VERFKDAAGGGTRCAARREKLRTMIISVGCSRRLVDDRFDVAFGGLDSASWLYFDGNLGGFYLRMFQETALPIELEDVCVDGQRVDFLDFTVWKDWRAKKLASCLYDKRRAGKGALFFKDYRTFHTGSRGSPARADTASSRARSFVLRGVVAACATLCARRVTSPSTPLSTPATRGAWLF
jgi:hypothetical protein